MDLIKTHEIMENELRCVQRASVNACDRDCKHCDLLMDTDEIIQAYGMVIKMLETWSNHVDQIVDLKNFLESQRQMLRELLNKTNI